MSLCFVTFMCFLITLITITLAPQPQPAHNEDTTLSADEFNALEGSPKNKYFIFPVIDDLYLQHLYPWPTLPYQFHTINKIFNYVENYAEFDRSTIRGPQQLHHVAIFVQKGKFFDTSQQQHHTAKIEYHCYNHDTMDERSLIQFYHHIQPSLFHKPDNIYQIKNCQIHIFFYQTPVGKTVTVSNGKISVPVPEVYIRKANTAQQIIYIQHSPHLKGNNYEFWKEHKHMFDSNIIDKFDHTYTFNPIQFKHAKRPQMHDPCNDHTLVNHDGIILIDKDVYPFFFLKQSCLENIHLKNIAKHFSTKIFPQTPLRLKINIHPYDLGNIIPKRDHHQTQVLTSYELIGNHPAAQITWKEMKAIHGTITIREYHVDSTPNCRCDEQPADDCARICSIILYIMPSAHSHQINEHALTIKHFLTEQRIENVLTELNPHKFQAFWNDGNIFRGDLALNQDAYIAALEAIEEHNTWIKKLILTDFSPNYMWTSSNGRFYHLLRPYESTKFPVFHGYYHYLWAEIRSHVMVKVINNAAMYHLEANEKAFYAVGRSHYRAFEAGTWEVDVGYFSPVQQQQNQGTIGSTPIRKYQPFVTYFGKGMQDLLKNPQKLLEPYFFGGEPVSWHASNHKQYFK